tara:strand:- start:90 stop:266 length:177 start_codon:yes stop_codon:yes gene_type:complete
MDFKEFLNGQQPEVKLVVWNNHGHRHCHKDLNDPTNVPYHIEEVIDLPLDDEHLRIKR